MRILGVFPGRRVAFLSSFGLCRRAFPISAAILLQSKVSMADIHPFRAFRYDLQQVSAAQVVTQPYDKITPAMQERYYAASPYNLVRIILGRRAADENAGDNVYTRSAAFGRQWRDQGIFRQDSCPLLLRLLPDLHRPVWQELRAPRIHRPGPRRGLFRQSGLPPRADSLQAQGRPPRPAARHPRPLRATLPALRRFRRDRFPARSQTQFRSHHRCRRRIRRRPPRLASFRPRRPRRGSAKDARQKASHRRRPPPLRNRTQLSRRIPRRRRLAKSQRSLRIRHDDLRQHERSRIARPAHASRRAFARFFLGRRLPEIQQPLL